MREILFRGKAINRDKGFHRTIYKNGEWVYGLVTRLYDERFETLPAEMRDIDGVGGIEVDYNTIGQYTGLTDNNGTKIFEGDIVKIQIGNIIKYGSVFYSEKAARVGIREETSEVNFSYMQQPLIKQYQITFISNIFLGNI